MMGIFKELQDSPFYAWTCGIDLDNLERSFSYCKSKILIYQVGSIPKLPESGKIHDELIGHIIKQKIFFEGLSSAVLNAEEFLKGSFEIRFENVPSTRTINTFLLLRLFILNNRTYELQNYKKHFEAILPIEYEIKEIDNVEEKRRILSLGEKKVVEIVKVPKFLSVGKFSSQAPVADQFWQYDAMDKNPCRVPCVSTFDPVLNDLSNFYRVLQECEDHVMIRFSFAQSEIHNIEKTIAQNYKDIITQAIRENPNADASNYNAAFAKYETAENLVSLKIQVASQNILKATSIAHTFCGQLSSTSLSSNIIYKAFSTEGFGKEEKEFLYNDWSHCNHYYFDFWQLPYYPSTAVKSFMIRLLYLYNTVEYLVPFRIPISLPQGLPGMVTKSIKPFYQPNPSVDNDADQISLGKIIGSGRNEKEQIDYKIPISNLTKHGLIVGATGSGKTNTTLNFVKELCEHGIPFLLIEPVKSEYYNELSAYLEKSEHSKFKKLNRFNFRKPFLSDGTCNPEFLRFNPFYPVKGISIVQHISYIKNCITAAFPMDGIVPLILEECLYQLYLDQYDNDRQLFDPGESPEYPYDKEDEDLDELATKRRDFLTFDGLIEVINNFLKSKELFTKEDQGAFGSYLRRRMKKLTEGVLGNAFIPDLWLDSDEMPCLVQDNISKILREPTIIELEDLADNDEKALMMAFILTFLFEYRQTQEPVKTIGDREGKDFDLKKHIHITIIEEAHRLLSNIHQNSGGGADGTATENSKSKAISLFIDMLAEIRAKGEGIFIVEQIPTKLVSDAIKNTNLKIMHRITSKDDRHYLGEAMNMTEAQKNYVNTLKTGDAIIFEEALDNPIFVKMNLFENEKK